MVALPMANPETGANDIRFNGAYDCDSLLCVAYGSGAAYCTAPCDSDEDCPESFSCRQVLQSAAGPPCDATSTATSGCARIQPTDTFCVRDAHDCTNF